MSLVIKININIFLKIVQCRAKLPQNKKYTVK